MSRSTALAALLTVSLLAACGSDTASDSGRTAAAATPAASATAPAATAAAPAATAAAPAATTAAPEPTFPKDTKAHLAQCHALLDRGVKAVYRVYSVARVSSGYAIYKTRVKKAQRIFGRIKLPELEEPNWCLEYAYIASQQALSHYTVAGGIWAKCKPAGRCDTKTMRLEWVAARGNLVERAAHWFGTPKAST